MDCCEALLTFCQKHKEIYCYGAGDYGSYLYFYLKLNHISVTGFIVSNAPIDTMQCNVPVHELTDYESFPLGTGIILSLAHKHQAGILEMLHKRYNSVDVYELYDEEIVLIKQIGLVQRQKHIYELLNDVFCHRKNRINKDQNFNKNIHLFCEKYTDIYLRYMDMRQLGAISSWVYYVNERQKDNRTIFYLFYPYVWGSDKLNPERWMGVNHYLSTKLSLPGIAMITDVNIFFWQVLLKKYLQRKHVIFDDQFQLFEYVRLFNIAAQHYKEPLTAPKYISFTSEENQIFSMQMQYIGVHSDFVCISARNSIYRREITQNKNANEDIIDYYRNTDIRSYRKAIHYLTSQGVQTIRMGALVDVPLQGKGLIDYASNHRTEALDVFLLSRCQFFVSDPSGIQFLAGLFSKPLVIINTAVLTTNKDLTLLLDPRRDIAIPKKLWDSKHKHFLTFRDMLDMEVSSFDTQKKFDCGPQNAFLNYYAQGIIPIDNTPEEILDVIQEMWLRLHNSWESNDQDEALQLAYRKIVDQYPKKDNFLFHWRMGAKFLRENMWILQ